MTRCPDCDAPMRLVELRNGGRFYGCTRYPTCRGHRDPPARPRRRSAARSASRRRSNRSPAIRVPVATSRPHPRPLPIWLRAPVVAVALLLLAGTLVLAAHVGGRSTDSSRSRAPVERPRTVSVDRVGTHSIGAGRKVTCADGSTSMSGGRQGACSWHGGVASAGRTSTWTGGSTTNVRSTRASATVQAQRASVRPPSTGRVVPGTTGRPCEVDRRYPRLQQPPCRRTASVADKPHARTPQAP